MVGINFEDWEQRKLGEENDVRDGTHDSPKYFDSGYPLITSKNLKDYGLDMTDVSLISHKDFEAINQRSKVDRGDILFGMIGTIGNPVLIERDDFAIKNVALIKEQKNVLNRFLIQLLKSPIFDKYIENEMAGGTQKFLSLSKIRSFNFRVPSTEEQASIANFLGQLDDTIALHQDKLEKLKQLKKGYLQLMFPQKDEKVPRLRFAHFSSGWEQRKLSDFTKLITKGTTPKDKSGHGTINFVKIENISNGKIYSTTKIYEKEHENYLKRSKLKEKDVLFSIAGTLGRTAVVDKSILPANTNQALAIIREYDFDTDFLLVSLSGKVAVEFIRKNPTVGAQPNLSLEQVGKLDIWTPQPEEQQKVGSFFKQLDDTLSLHCQKIEYLNKIKKSYLQKLFA